MSRLWDTPEFWIRSEADEMLRDCPETGAAELADMFERTCGSYDGDPDLARGIVGELRRRADAGIRFWPDGPSLVRSPDPVTLPVVSFARPEWPGAGRGVAQGSLG